MDTTEFLFAQQNGPFLVAMAVTLAIAAVEMLSLVLGLGLSSMIDDLLPDFGPEVDVDVDVDVDVGAELDADVDLDAGPDTPAAEAASSNLVGQALGWLNVGRVPFLVLLITFLAGFAVIGLGAQLFAATVVGLIPAMIAAPAAAFLALPVTRTASRLLGHIVPREETYAVSEAQFVGLVATVTLGPVEAGNPGKAKLTDPHGNVHFVRVRAANRGARFETGSEVLLVKRDSSVFEVIAPPASLAEAR